MSDTSTSAYNQSSISSGIGGLVSGLDTDSLVEQLTYSTQSKINKQFQLQKSAEYKQDAYRELTGKLIDFEDKYFSYSSDTNILSPDFFDTAKITASSDSVSASGDSDVLSNLEITGIDSVATKANFSGSTVTDGTIKSDTVDLTKELSTLAGKNMSIKYGSTTYTITISDDFEPSVDPDVTDPDAVAAAKLQSVAVEINNQISKVEGLTGKMSYQVDPVDGNKLKVNNIDGGDIEITAVDDKISQTLNIDEGSDGDSDADIVADDLTYESKLSDIIVGSEIKFSYNGLVKSVAFSTSDFLDMGGVENIDASNLAKLIKDKLASAFGKIGEDNKISVEPDGDKLQFSSNGDSNIFGISSISSKLSDHLGLDAGEYNRIDLNDDLSELNGTIPELLPVDNKYTISVNGKEFTFDDSYSIKDIMSEINNDADADIDISYSSLTNKFTVLADNTGTQGKIEIKDVAGKGNLSEALFGSADTSLEYTSGVDTVMTVNLNGVKTDLTRSSKSISIDGATISLDSNAANEFVSGVSEDITFNIDSNASEVAGKVSDFIDDYNTLITYMTRELSTTHDRDYDPLTDAQRAEMSDDEQEDWDKEAKDGMLFSDNDVSNLYYSLRTAISGVVKGNDYMGSDLGISSTYGDYTGKLTFDKTEFENAYNKNSNAVKEFFTAISDDGSLEETGISGKMNSLLETYVGNYGEKGILVDIAGTKGTTSENSNYYYSKISAYQDLIDSLNETLETEQDRYWAQFTTLETTLSNLNAQSSWLSSEMS